ncbi:MAG: hypothetical protein JWP14_19 [Frankiales bacterium]|nr:hypothetical protein [Frankiales bacterium]
MRASQSGTESGAAAPADRGSSGGAAEVHPGLELLGCLDALRGVPVPLVYVRDQWVPLEVVQLLEAVMLLVRMRLVR